MQITRLLLTAWLFFFLALPAFSDEVHISEITVEISGGNTREPAVRRWLEIQENDVFESDAALADAAERDVQELVNLRIFKSVDFSIVRESGGSGRHLIITIQDAPTFVPVPMVLYDSNLGGVQILYVQIWDNMFGTLADWFSMSILTLRNGDEGKWETGPFYFAPQVSNIKIGDQVYAIRLEQQRVESQRLSGSILVSDYRYDRSALFFSTEFRFGPDRRLRYALEPGAEFRYGYRDYLGAGGFPRRPWGVQLEQSFYYDSVDAVGNSRRGWRTGLTNTLKLISEDGKVQPVVDISGEISPYITFDAKGILSYYARFSGMKVWGDTYELIGDEMRGIPDSTMDGDFALYLNQTLGIRIWRLPNVFDLQIHPFFDMGMTTGGTRDFEGWKDVRKSTGADILLFIEPVPNLAFRFTWGTDLDSDIAWGEEIKTEFIVRYAYSY